MQFSAVKGLPGKTDCVVSGTSSVRVQRSCPHRCGRLHRLPVVSSPWGWVQCCPQSGPFCSFGLPLPPLPRGQACLRDMQALVQLGGQVRAAVEVASASSLTEGSRRP